MKIYCSNMRNINIIYIKCIYDVFIIYFYCINKNIIKLNV